jgi:cysteine synthase
MTARPYLFGPTFDEMLHPDTMPAAKRQSALNARKNNDLLNPDLLWDITWRRPDGKVRCHVVPKALTGVDCDIVVLHGHGFPTGSHKVGATYSGALERQLKGDVTPGVHTLVWPSTGNYGIGGAWVGPRMGYESIVILPEEMSAERFQRIENYGAHVIKTAGCESNVKEIFDACKEIAKRGEIRVLNQFEELANYRFHWHVTGNSACDAVEELAAEGKVGGKVAAFVSAMGSAGTIAAGDRCKQRYIDCKIVGLEPVQCPTLYSNGYGGHDIQGIGDKHVTWIHNVTNMDALACVDDIECKLVLQVLTDPTGQKYLKDNLGLSNDEVEFFGSQVGISGICNILGAIKTAKHFGIGKGQTIVTVCTDGFDRYPSVMAQMQETYGPITEMEAHARIRSILLNQKTDYVQEGTVINRARWHQLKYYTWVEQQGKTVEELEAMRSQDFWLAQQAKVADVDKAQKTARGF